MLKLKLRSLLTFILLFNACVFMSAAPVGAVTGDGQPNDANIKYVGRWDTSDSTNTKGYWSGAYFRVNFTGTTLKIKLAAAADIFVTIDNSTPVYYPAANGTVNLTPTALSAGTHSLRINTRTEYQVLQFQGLVLSPGAVTQPPAARSKLIEFIGSSSTAGCCALPNYVMDVYGWLTGEMLNADHVQVAYSGMCLQNATCGVNNIGMSVQYFKLQNPQFPASPNWDFTRYQPDQVVISLGVNDSAVTDAAFQSTYIAFLANIRVKYPNAELYALRTLGGSKAAPTIAAVNARNAAGDAKVFYVTTNGWVTAGTADYTDSLHPSASGQLKIANRLAKVLTANRFESYNYPGSYIRHQDSRGKMGSNLGAYFADSQWKEVPGLANAAAISLESINYPGQYLRHRNGEIWMDANNGTALFKNDATWYQRPGLANATAKSFESYNLPGLYMRHYNGLLKISVIATTLEKADASFYVRTP